MSDAVKIEPIKILVIDDSEDDRLLYRRTLEKSADAGYYIIETDDGEEGLHLIQEEQPTCVLLDYSLPGRNGVEVLKRIRSKYPFMPVVMLTGQGNEAVAVTVMQEGAQNYIAKSNITPESLQRMIRVAIEYCALQKRIHEQRASLEVFTRALAHDLKEPVRTIRSFLDLLAAHDTLSEKGKGYFNYIQNAADRMNTLIDTVYFYTRLDGPESQISKEICDVSTAFENAKENIGALIRERKAVITCDPLPQVEANRIQLIQVLQNLLCNAIRHCEEIPHIHVHAEEATNQWLFRISDNGPGIGGEYHEKIFQPFKRLARHKEQGLGLGLAICKKIIESHGGKIWYESRPEVGATFLFTLPKGPAVVMDADHLAPPVPSQKNRVEKDGALLGTILLVEDNEADVELTRIMLIEEPHLRCNLIVARDGHEALDKLHSEAQKNSPVSLVLLDINMPGMDGFELLERIHAEDGLQQVPVIMCTTSTYDKDMEKAKVLGVTGYLTKPAELGKLKSIIDKTANVQLCREGDGYALLCAA